MEIYKVFKKIISVLADTAHILTLRANDFRRLLDNRADFLDTCLYFLSNLIEFLQREVL